jgi:predicted nucleic acid-binding protein
MIVYADASALVKRYVAEAGSAEVEKLLRAPNVAGTAVISRAEVAAALGKAARVGALTRTEAETALNTFRAQWPHLLRLRLNEAVIRRADELAWTLGLRGYYAVHLSAAETWQAALDERLILATYDRQLWEAGRQQGLAVWPEVL